MFFLCLDRVFPDLMPRCECILESSLQIRDEAQSEMELKMGVMEYIYQVQLSKAYRLILIFKDEKKSLWATKIITASHINYHVSEKKKKQAIILSDGSTDVGSSMAL